MKRIAGSLANGGADLQSNAYIFPKSIISFFCVVGSTLTTASGVPIRSVPSSISTPRMIGSRLQNAAMTFSRQGHTA
jgi:hypothetical protein